MPCPTEFKLVLKHLQREEPVLKYVTFSAKEMELSMQDELWTCTQRLARSAVLLTALTVTITPDDRAKIGQIYYILCTLSVMKKCIIQIPIM